MPVKLRTCFAVRVNGVFTLLQGIAESGSFRRGVRLRLCWNRWSSLLARFVIVILRLRIEL